jgi:cysteine desulfurase/selenocysteine lyase
VYFDNAATSQTPQIVIDTIVDYYRNFNANIHRGVHTLSQVATDKYEEGLIKIQQHFNDTHTIEMIYPSETTHSINIIALGFETLLKKEDEIIVSALKHHSNIVPWHMLCKLEKYRFGIIS